MDGGAVIGDRRGAFLWLLPQRFTLPPQCFQHKLIHFAVFTVAIAVLLQIRAHRKHQISNGVDVLKSVAPDVEPRHAAALVATTARSCRCG